MTGIYVHTPFCRSKCGYCDFNSYAGLHGLADDYAAALIKQIERPPALAEAVPPPGTFGTPERPIDSIFFGGGNPALLGRHLPEVLESCRRRWEVSAEAEISVEMNPEDATTDSLQDLREAGFNRLSLGWQSLDDRHLAQLGRRHDSRTALESLVAARLAGFTNVNIDMIFGLPGQTIREWEAELARALAAAPDHLSVYSLSIEPGTRFFDLFGPDAAAHRGTELGGPPPLPGEDEAADMYALARRLTRAAGYEHYEISNFALEGRRCRHNMNYWRGGDYLGFGAGAHSHLAGCRWWNKLDPAAFIGAPGSVGGRERLTPSQRLSERIFLGLRLIEGIEPGPLEREFGMEINKEFGATMARMRALGLLAPGPRLALTEDGLPLANEVMVGFV